MTASQWDLDRESYFAKRRTGHLPKEEPKKEAKVEQRKKTSAKAKPAPQKQENERNENVDAFRVLVNCFWAAILHLAIQYGLYWMFATGGIEAAGLMVGTMANCMVAGFRVAWRFKVGAHHG